jgi:hypothetical protein
MKKALGHKSRKKLRNKIVDALDETMQPLSKEFQMLLADDLITAFESRLKIFNNPQTSTDCYIEIASEIEQQMA